MNTRIKIRWVSDILRYLVISYMIFLPLFDVGFWISGGDTTFASEKWIYEPFVGIDLVPSLNELGAPTRLVALLINLSMRTSIVLLILACIAALLKRYRNLSFFTIDHVKLFKKIGCLSLIYQLCTPLYDFAMTYIIMLMHSTTDRISVIGVSSLTIELIVVSIFILLISWIMEEGFCLQEEQKLVV